MGKSRSWTVPAGTESQWEHFAREIESIERNKQKLMSSNASNPLTRDEIVKIRTAQLHNHLDFFGELLTAIINNNSVEGIAVKVREIHIPADLESQWDRFFVVAHHLSRVKEKLDELKKSNNQDQALVTSKTKTLLRRLIECEVLLNAIKESTKDARLGLLENRREEAASREDEARRKEQADRAAAQQLQQDLQKSGESAAMLRQAHGANTGAGEADAKITKKTKTLPESKPSLGLTILGSLIAMVGAAGAAFSAVVLVAGLSGSAFTIGALSIGASAAMIAGPVGIAVAGLALIAGVALAVAFGQSKGAGFSVAGVVAGLSALGGGLLTAFGLTAGTGAALTIGAVSISAAAASLAGPIGLGVAGAIVLGTVIGLGVAKAYEAHKAAEEVSFLKLWANADERKALDEGKSIDNIFVEVTKLESDAAAPQPAAEKDAKQVVTLREALAMRRDDNMKTMNEANDALVAFTPRAI